MSPELTPESAKEITVNKFVRLGDQVCFGEYSSNHSDIAASHFKTTPNDEGKLIVSDAGTIRLDPRTNNIVIGNVSFTCSISGNPEKQRADSLEIIGKIIGQEVSQF